MGEAVPLSRAVRAGKGESVAIKQLTTRGMGSQKQAESWGKDFREETVACDSVTTRLVSFCNQASGLPWLGCAVLVCSGGSNKIPGTRQLVNNRNVFLTVLEAGSYKITAPADAMPGEDRLPGSQPVPF